MEDFEKAGFPSMVEERLPHATMIAALLATILPSGQTATAPGGHDWRTWSLLWERLLASGALAGPPPGGGGAV